MRNTGWRSAAPAAAQLILAYSALLLSATSTAQSRPVGTGTERQAAGPASEEAAALEDLKQLMMQDVVVTARRTIENMMDVPISVTALTTDLFEKLGATNLRDIGFAAPNLLLRQEYGSPSLSTLSIRGVENVGVYIDEVYIGFSDGYQASLLDVERVEVLRGPQGTLFGKNTVAGLLNISLRKPPDELSFRGTATVGDYALRGFNANAAGPVTDKIRFSASGFVRQRDGFVRVDAGPDGNTEDARGGRIGLFFEPSERFSFNIRADYTHEEPRIFYLDPIIDHSGPGLAALDGDPFDRHVGPQDVVNRSLHKDRGVSARADLRIGDGYTLTSISAKRRIDVFFIRDNDYTALDILTARFAESFRQISQEIRLASRQDQRFKWLAGAFYFKGKLNTESRDIVGADFPTAFGLTLGEYFLLQDQLGFGLPLAAPQFTIFRPSAEETQSLAGFVSATCSLTDQLAATAGARYTSERVRQVSETYASDELLGIATGVPPVPRDATSTTTHDLSPTISVTYKSTADRLLYFTWARGFTSGGTNAASAAIPPGTSRQFEPEKMDNFELGIKAQLFARRLRITGDVFQMNYSNLQRTQNVVVAGCPTTGCTLTTNAANARIRGLELDLAALPSARLSVNAGVGYSDAKYRRYPDAPFQLTDGTAEFRDLSGASLAIAPQWTVSAGAQYTAPLNQALDGFFGGQFQYVSQYLIASGDNPLLTIQHQSRMFANAGMRTKDGKWSVTARMSNMFDRKYINNLNQNAAIGTDFIGLIEPRQFQVELGVRF